MVARPSSRDAARATLSSALNSLNSNGIYTPCHQRPAPYNSRQTPEDAAALCGRGTVSPCPVLELCAQAGFTEGGNADDMVYGGYAWRKGTPVVSETAHMRRRRKLEERKSASRRYS